MSQSKSNPVAHMVRSSEFTDLFPAPLMQTVLPNMDAFNQRLSRTILERAERMPSARLSNQGGWQSQDVISSWGGPEAKQVFEYMLRAIELATARLKFSGKYDFSFNLVGWANVNRNGDYNTLHVHPGSTWSCVYYVDAGSPGRDADDGAIVFHHQNRASVMSFFPGLLPECIPLQPVSGMLLVFPSYLPHSVAPYRGDKPRISIAANAHGGFVAR